MQMLACMDTMTCYILIYVYLVQVTRPVPFPCFGVLQKEKHVLLHSVADVVVEQGVVFAVLFCVYLSFWTSFFSFWVLISNYLFW